MNRVKDSAANDRKKKAPKALFDSVEVSLGIIMSSFFRIMGPLLAITLYFVLGLQVHAFFWIIVPLLKKRLGTELGLAWIAIGLVVLYNIVFNHIMAMTIKATGPKSLKLIEKLRQQYKQRKNRKSVQVNLEMVKSGVSDDRFEGLSSEVKRLLRYRNKTLPDLETFWTKRCDKCETIKPARTHHCSICNECVFLMDHHCPWVNNCLGLDNYRYFLLFVLYLWIGVIYMAVTIMSIWHHHTYKLNQTELSFCYILDLVLAVVLLGFNGWNWFLAFNGKTTIEFWTESTDSAELSFSNSSDNLYRVFGTFKLFRILSPSLRNVPFTGLEWSYYFKDEGFDCNGKRLPETELTAV